MDETIAGGSPVGKRLTNVGRKNMKFLVHGGKKVRLADIMTIGRDRGNAITIDDPLVSRVHCTIRRIRTGWYIEDAGSRNGTWLNGRKLKPGKAVRLTPDDVIKLGGRIEVSLI